MKMSGSGEAPGSEAVTMRAMASLRKELVLAAPADRVWSALRDFGAVHRRLAPGFVTDATMEGDDVRVVTFFNGATARETLVGRDDALRRLAYAIIGGRASHYAASAEVAGRRRRRLPLRLDRRRPARRARALHRRHDDPRRGGDEGDAGGCLGPSYASASASPPDRR